MKVTATNLITVHDYVVEQIIEVSPTRRLYVTNKRKAGAINDYDYCTFIANSKDTLVDGTHYRHRDLQKRAEYIENIIAQAASHEESKARRKRLLEEEAKQVQPGDIYVAQYGYEANFCDFMQVISVKGTRAKVRAIGKSRTYGGSYDANGSLVSTSSAVKDKFIDDKVYNKPLHGAGFRHNGHYYYKWNGHAIDEYNDH